MLTEKRVVGKASPSDGLVDEEKIEPSVEIVITLHGPASHWSDDKKQMVQALSSVWVDDLITMGFKIYQDKEESR